MTTAILISRQLNLAREEQVATTARNNVAIVAHRHSQQQQGKSKTESGRSLLHNSQHGATKCTFCDDGIPNLALLIPETGGNTCSSIKSMAAGEVNGSGICSIIQEKETLCCPVVIEGTAETTLFTPDEFRAGRIENYVNLPTIYNADRDDIVKQLMDQPVPEPAEILLHKAPTPPKGHAILGLASYPTFKNGWLKMVGSLRTNGYEGHIIVGVHRDIPRDEREYLDKMGGECLCHQICSFSY